VKQILLVGEAPGKRGLPGEAALSGRAGRRLAGLMGLPFEEYLKGTERWNVLPSWPGKAAGHGAAWPRAAARKAAERFARGYRDHAGFREKVPMIILLGRRVADAFGHGSEAPWFASTWNLMLQQTVHFSPHPSGASRWWNSSANRRAASMFWLEAACHE
jgi:uracil-DNA glycosylase